MAGTFSLFMASWVRRLSFRWVGVYGSSLVCGMATTSGCALLSACPFENFTIRMDWKLESWVFCFF